jgi:hypothetical protein
VANLPLALCLASCVLSPGLLSLVCPRSIASDNSDLALTHSLLVEHRIRPSEGTSERRLWSPVPVATRHRSETIKDEGIQRSRRSHRSQAATHVGGGVHMERVLIGLLVLGFMLSTMLVCARLAVRQPGKAGQEPDPIPLDPPPATTAQSAELAGLFDSGLRSALK